MPNWRGNNHGRALLAEILVAIRLSFERLLPTTTAALATGESYAALTHRNNRLSLVKHFDANSRRNSSKFRDRQFSNSRKPPLPLLEQFHAIFPLCYRRNTSKTAIGASRIHPRGRARAPIVRESSYASGKRTEIVNTERRHFFLTRTAEPCLSDLH